MINDKKQEKDFETGVVEKHPDGRDEEQLSNNSQQEPTGEAYSTDKTYRDKKNSMELLSSDEVDDFQSRWHVIQMSFVDEPHSAVDEADTLTVELIEHLTDHITKKQNQLKAQWLDGSEHSTEDYRIGLQKYRGLFNQLLATP